MSICISEINSILQTAVMVITVVVTWRIYKNTQKDKKKDVARKILVEYEKGMELLEKAKEIITEDAMNYNVRKLITINYVNCNFWEDNGHILRKNLNESEFKNIELYFRNLKNLSELLDSIKEMTKQEYLDFYQRYNETLLGKELSQNQDTPILRVLLPADYTISVIDKCKEIELLSKVFPKEKIGKLSK